MFERFTEAARRVLYWARHAALTDDQSEILPRHLLTGINKERPDLLKEAGFKGLKLRLKRIEVKAGKGGVPQREAPLHLMSRRALQIADRTATRLNSEAIAVVHLLWGTLEADRELAKRVQKAGLKKSTLLAMCRAFSAGAGQEILTRDFFLASQRRSGIGYDLHRLEAGRKLIVGGVEIAFEKGPAGHSDGDALSHAVCDALLGAAGLGDIGTHFPDTDPKWKGVSSLLFLEHVRKLYDERSLRITHIDAVVIAERPKLGPHFPAMREALAKALGISPEQINLKAKTNEGVDAIGRGEAIAAQAIATIEG